LRNLNDDDDYQSWRQEQYYKEHPPEEMDDEEMEQGMRELQMEGEEMSRVLKARLEERQKRKGIE
jgi:hypothetical protein